MLTFSQLGRYGRIGNQMFQIAGVIGIATKHGYRFGFPEWKNYDQLERFGGGEDIDIQRWFANHLPAFEGIVKGRYNIKWGFHSPDVEDDHDFTGHFQSDKYFVHCEDAIRHYFEFANKTEPKPGTIAVHFRGGDYGGDYHPTCTRDYYWRAFREMPEGLRVLLFTDDPKRAAEVMPFEYELVSGNHSMVDMEIMSRCDHHIIANSTFSWWGAWLANSKKVVAPKLWFGPAANLSSADLYPKNWIVL